MDNAVTNTLASLPLHIVLATLAGILIMLIIGILIYLFIVPLTQRSSTMQHCIFCCKNQSDHLTPATDIFLDNAHIFSGQQIRVFITTIAAPACSLCFTGSVCLSGFQVSTGRLQVTLHIDWHNCLLHYNEFVIPLPDIGTAFVFQPNLLTDFS